jgi:isopentenyl-diphosphate delta-isomerase
MDLKGFESRKRDHLNLALDTSTQALGLSGLDLIHLHHNALPDIDFDQVTLESFGLSTPFFIPGMTAGHDKAFEVNQVLAKVCALKGWALGIGSQRRELTDPLMTEQLFWRKVRQEHPHLFLIANLGISQALEVQTHQIEQLVESVGANAVAFHLNALQEVIQPEGTPKFKGAFEALKSLSQSLSVPVIVKETGCGFSRQTLQKLSSLKLMAIDLSGLGGTHWGRIEGLRAKGTVQAQVAETFKNWGESTVDSLAAARLVFEPRSAPTEIWASGGVRTGLEAAKLIALGAKRVGYARPALEMALQGEKALVSWTERIELELKTALFCMGLKSPSELLGNTTVWKMKI